MLALLGDFLRSLLELGRREEIPLAQELELARQYLAIEQVRLGNRVRIEFPTAPAAEPTLVPALLLQPLLENAVRHGVLRGGAGEIAVRVECRADTVAILVENTRSIAAATQTRGGLGLASTRERLHAHYGPDCEFSVDAADPGRWRVHIAVPAREEGAAACAS